MNDFLLGAMAMACWASALFFLRFWCDTKDRLFLLFSMSFFLLGITRIGLALFHEVNEPQTYFHWIRFAAFVMILVAIVNKNRK